MSFTDIAPFDWSSIINDQQGKPGQDHQLKNQPLSPVSDNDNQTNVWLEGFLTNTTTDDMNSNTAVPVTAPPSNGSDSPLEFSSLFDVAGDEMKQTESLFSSAVSSLDNSPMIKSEDKFQEIPPQLQLTGAKITRNISSSTISSELSESTPSSATKKPKKKRAPRKRLTAHQKQAHNKIEKRYRININAKIAGLQQIIPWVASEKTAFETGGNVSVKTEEESTDVPRLNKSMILEKATSYILFLQEKESKMQTELETLRKEVTRLGGNC